MKKINEPEDLDIIFESLSSKHRREIIYALGFEPHSISQLAEMRELSLPAIHKHIKILQIAGLVVGKKIGRIHFLALNKQKLLKVQNWLMQYHTYWGNDKETFENYANYLSNKKTKGGDKK